MAPKVVPCLILLCLQATPLAAQTSVQRSRRAVARQTGVITPTAKDLAGTFRGTLKFLSSKEIIIETSEDQTVSIRRSRKTKFYKDGKEVKATDLTLNEPVSVDAAEDNDLKPTAVS